MSKLYKSLLLMAWFTVGIADTQKLVAQNQVQTFTCNMSSGNDYAGKDFSSGRIDFTSSPLSFTEDGRGKGIYFLHPVEKGETAVRILMNYKVYRSI